MDIETKLTTREDSCPALDSGRCFILSSPCSIKDYSTCQTYLEYIHARRMQAKIQEMVYNLKEENKA